jgi:hypothetical protein
VIWSSRGRYDFSVFRKPAAPTSVVLMPSIRFVVQTLFSARIMATFRAGIVVANGSGRWLYTKSSFALWLISRQF